MAVADAANANGVLSWNRELSRPPTGIWTTVPVSDGSAGMTQGERGQDRALQCDRINSVFGERTNDSEQLSRQMRVAKSICLGRESDFPFDRRRNLPWRSETHPPADYRDDSIELTR